VAQRKGEDYRREGIRRMSSFNTTLSEILKDEEVYMQLHLPNVISRVLGLRMKAWCKFHRTTDMIRMIAIHWLISWRHSWLGGY